MAVVTTFLEPGTDATQDLNFYASATSTVSSATDQAFTGPRSAKLGYDATNAHLKTPLSILADAGTQFSADIRLSSVSPSADIGILIFGNSTYTAVFSLRIATTGALKLVPVGGTIATSSTILSVDTWYRIGVSYYITDSSHYQIKVYINDSSNNLLETLTANNAGGTLTRTATSGIDIMLSSVFPAGSNFWLDNIYVATGGASSSSQPDPGNILVTAKRPNANGTTNNFVTQIGSGGSGYGTGHSPQVNEQPLSITNGWSVVAVGSAVTEEYNIEGLTVGDVNLSGATIVDVGGWIYTKALAGETVQLRLNNADTAKTITTSAAMYTAFAGSTTYPAGTGTDIGEVTDTTVTTVSLYECGVLVAYIPGTASTRGNLLPLLGVS